MLGTCIHIEFNHHLLSLNEPKSFQENSPNKLKDALGKEIISALRKLKVGFLSGSELIVLNLVHSVY